MNQFKVQNADFFIRGIESEGYSYNEQYGGWIRYNCDFIDFFGQDSDNQLKWIIGILAVPIKSPYD
jgi:hypothetical protein